MYDKLKEFPLFRAFEGLPKHPCAEDGDMWDGVESISHSGSQIGSEGAAKENDIDIQSSAKTLASVATSLVTAVERMQNSFGQMSILNLQWLKKDIELQRQTGKRRKKTFEGRNSVIFGNLQ